MATLVGGIGTSHVPSIGRAVDLGKQQTEAWKPLFDGFVPVREWLDRIRPDVAIIVYNDHGTDFFLDKLPTFAIGAAVEYGIGDESFGKRPLPPVPGDPEFSQHLCESLIYNEFDMTVCQELAVDHGCLVPLNLCWDHGDGWPIKVVPVVVNVLQHPLPTAMRCFKLGHALRRAVDSFPQDRRVVIFGTGGLSHQLHGERFGFLNGEWDREWMQRIVSEPEQLAQLTHQTLVERGGAESVEMIMWLAMRGALGKKVRLVHQNYYAPMTTGMGLVALEDVQ